MKNVHDIIKNRVADGLVIDVRGCWVPIAEKVEHERSFLLHLEAGEILLNKKWVSIDEAKHQNPAQSVHNFSGSDIVRNVGAYTELEDTKDLTDHKSNKGKSELITDYQYNFNTDSSDNVALSDIQVEEETRTIYIKQNSTGFSKKDCPDYDESNLYLEETMSFDMKDIINSSREPVGKFVSKKRSDQKEVFGDIIDDFETEQKKKITLIFSISATIALFAIAGAIILGFVL
jgi:hypothetical protein